MTTPEVSQRLQDLVNTTGYEITQRCGQRFYGPPPNWSDTDRPERGCEVFVGRLPRDLFEDELVPVMSSVAPIYQLRLIMDFSGTNKGFAFVTYTRRWAAIQAIRQLNNYEIRPNHRIGVTQSLDNCRLFLGNLPLNKTRQEVEEEISSKTKGVVNVIVYYNSYESIPNGSNGCDGQPKTRGFAFVEYESHRAAAMARKCLLPGSKSGKVSLFGVQVTLDWAIPEQRADKQLMDRVTVLFVRYLGSEATEHVIKEFFSLRYQLGVQRVKRIKNYAFIHFNNRSDAEKAFEYISNLDLTKTPLGEGNEPIEVMWAKPPPTQPPTQPAPPTRHNRSSYDQLPTKDTLNPMANPFRPPNGCKTSLNKMDFNGYIRGQGFNNLQLK